MKKDTDFSENLKRELDQFTVDFPSEEQIDLTIANLHNHVEHKVHPLEKLYFTWKDVFSLAYRELVFISPMFWILNLIFLFFGIANISFFGFSLYMTLFLMAPLPLIVGFIELLKSKDSNLLELESTTKFSWEHIVYSKLFIISLMHLIIISSLIGWSSAVLQMTLTISQLLQYWILPTLIFTSVGLFVSLHFSRKISTYVLLFFGFVFFYISRNLESYNHFFKKFDTPIIVTITFICIFVIGIQIKYLTKKGDVHLGTIRS